MTVLLALLVGLAAPFAGADTVKLKNGTQLEGKIVKRSKKIYTMMLFGMLNFSHTWYDPKGDIEPKEFADMVVDLFLYGFTPPGASAQPRAQRHRA